MSCTAHRSAMRELALQKNSFIIYYIIINTIITKYYLITVNLNIMKELAGAVARIVGESAWWKCDGECMVEM